RVRAIHEVLTALWLSEYPNPASSDGLADPTLACLCMQAVNADGSYMQTGEYASVLAHLTRAIGLCVATEIHAVVAEHAPCLPPDSHLSHLAGTRVDGIRSLLRWVDENNWSTYATLRAHERHARALLGSALHQNLWWVDTHNHTELSIGGYRLTLDHLRSIASNLQSKIVDSFQRLTADLPTTIAYDVLADDLHNDVSGYSAVDLLWHNRPEQFADFARRLLDHPALGLTRDMNAELAVKPTRAWLQALERHELLTLVYVQLTCGGPARGTGPIRLSMRNPTGALRSLHILGGRVCLVLPSMDSSSAYERDEVIVIPLDGFIGDMLIRTLAFCRRVAEFLVNKLSPSSAAESARLYRDLCFTALGRPFTSDDVSNALAAESFPTIGFDLHLPLFRMGFRAWNNALVPKYHATGDGDDGGLAEPLDALRAGYGCERGRHLQGLCRHDFRGTPLARLHVQMHNVDRWQIILNLQPGGKRVPYYEARSTLEAAPAPGIQAPAPSTPRQLAQLLTSQIASVTALARTLTQQSDRLRLEVSGLRARIDSPGTLLALVPPFAPYSSPCQMLQSLSRRPHRPRSRPRLSSPEPLLPPNLNMRMFFLLRVRIPNAAEQDGSLSSLSDMQISSPPCTYLARSSHRLSDLKLAEYNPRASSFIPTDLRSRGNSNASMGEQRTFNNAIICLSPSMYVTFYTLDAVAELSLLVFPREDGLHFMDARPYHDPYHIPPSDAICVARRLLGDPDAQWMSDAQYGAVSAMAGLERDLCIVMRHGGGKSLAVIIPTVFEDGITVIIVPFDALAQRWAKRLDGLRIAYELFDSGSEDISGDKKIVLVSLDSAALASWRDALVRLEARGALVLRIVVDDAHAVVASSRFSLALREMGGLRTVNAPIVLLTSHMSPHALPFFRQEYQLAAPLVIRDLTDRPEILYDVTPSMELPGAAALTRRLWTRHIDDREPVDRFFVFVFSVAKGRELARLTHLPFWHAASENIGEPQPAREHLAAYADFVQGNPPGLIVFGTLDSVADHPHARFAVLVHPPPNLALVMHLCGWISHDGLPGFVYIVPAPAPYDSTASPELAMLRGARAMIQIQYVLPFWPADREHRCIRCVVLEATDGIRMCCYEIADAVLCTFCQQCKLDIRLNSVSL
ncbi:hypothetical protein K525DRAFT_211077, partial [Schizophyllum commune Loenen D]